VSRSSTGTLLVALAAGGWGTWALFLRGSGVPPAWQSALILSVIGLAALPSALLRRGNRRRSGSWALLGVAALTDAGNYICYFGALFRGPIAVAVLTHYLAPVVVAGLAPAVLREPLRRRTVIALGASLAGLALLVLGDGGLPRTALWTALLGAVSALFYGGNTLVTKKLFEDFSPAEVLSYHCLLAALLVAGSAREPAPALSAFLWSPLCGALLLGACGASLFYAGLRRIPAQRAAVLTYLEPVVAAMVGALFFGERLGPAGVVGATLILGGGVAVALAPVTVVE
jgi:drug/metabolite transporter (DMT)-like permease